MFNKYFLINLEEIKKNKFFYKNYMVSNTQTEEDIKKELNNLKMICEEEGINMKYVRDGANITVSFLNTNSFQKTR